MKKLLIFFPIFIIHTLSFAQSNKFIFTFLNTKVDKVELPKEEVDKIMKGHLANINKMAKEGKLLVAGPFEGGGGIFIFKSTSVEEVNEWISEDPGIKANRWDVEILPFTIRAGGACAVGETYEMTMYHFIRYNPNLTKFTIGDAPLTFKRHDDYLKKIEVTGNVIAEGNFGDREGGILILKGDLETEVIEFDPAVQEGLLELDFKKLWVAKGSFCEQ
ncbi:MAG: hypothetical protein JJE09_03635 [Bacteroidia bacterium]|nr:hypothetical protein [Bacteroidia bacterium]